jgi:uncharacterized protein YbjT (DUF2867 family)
MHPILVIGASGNVGGKVAAGLAAEGMRVRAMSRNPEAARFPPGVEVVRADLTRPQTLDPALDGIETVFLVWTAPKTAFEPAFEQIAKRARRIVFLSAPLKTPHPFFQQPNASRVMAEQIERAIEGSGLEWTLLRPGIFAGNASVWWGRQIRMGHVVRWPYLAAPTAPIDERDIAAVAVRVLREEGHGGGEYVMTGPESLTQREQIATIGRAIGQDLRVEEMSPDEARIELMTVMDWGMAPATGVTAVINKLLDAWGAAIGQPAFVTSTVEEMTGRPARTFREWATDYAADFRLRSEAC